MAFFRKHIKLIIKIQALWRGHSARQQVALVHQTKRADSRYFTVDEQRETISNAIYNPNAKREQRTTYKFKTGATYDG
jgi:hypothetical protein